MRGSGAPGRCRAAWAGAALVLALLPVPARAEMKEYQIRRLLMLKTECQVTGLEGPTLVDGKHRFYAQCENVGHYPDGVDILCRDTEDDRDCTILTKKRKERNPN